MRSNPKPSLERMRNPAPQDDRKVSRAVGGSRAIAPNLGSIVRLLPTGSETQREPAANKSQYPYRQEPAAKDLLPSKICRVEFEP